MSWTYLKFDINWDPLPDSPSLPGPQTVYLGFDLLRGAVVLAYTERGGYHSFLGPNVEDDCHIVAFAPLSETSDPDPDVIKQLTPYTGRTVYSTGYPVKLLREESKKPNA